MSSNRKEHEKPAKQGHKAGDSIMAASIAGLVETVFFHPVDTVAKRMQKKVGAMRQPGEGFIPAFSKVAFGAAHDQPALARWTSLYPGLGWAMGYKIMQRGYKFGGQPLLQEFCEDNYADSFNQLFGSNAKVMMHAVTGAALGAGEVIFLPIDAMKIKSQTNKASYQGMSLLEIARAENLYKGISFTVSRNIIGSAALFATPFFIKTSVLGLDASDKLTNAQSIMCSMTASANSILFSSPMDVVKTRIQSEKTKQSGLKVGLSMFKNEGITSFFKGAGTKVAMQGPKLAFAMFLTNKLAEALSDKRQNTQENTSISKKI